MNPYEYTSDSGSLRISLHDSILEVAFSGNIGEAQVNYLYKRLPTIVKQIPTKHWAYFSHTESVFAATPQALEMLIEASRYCQQNGCVIAAYVLNTAIAVSQTQQLRDALAIEQPLDEVLFETDQEAKQYLLAVLKNFEE